MFWITLSLLLYLSILVSLFMAFMFPQRLLAGLLTFFITMFICSTFLGKFKILFQLLFFYNKGLLIHYIYVILYYFYCFNYITIVNIATQNI